MEYPLHSAVEENRLDAISGLLKKEVDINGFNDKRLTPLHIAVKDGNKDMVRLLLEKGAKVDLKWDGLTALHIAVVEGYLEILRLLVERGANLDELTPEGFYPISVAIRKSYFQIVKFLLSQGSKIDKEDAFGLTPLYHAVMAGDLEVLEAVLSCSPSVKSKGNKEAFKSAIREHLPHGLLIFHRLVSYGFTYDSDIINDGELLLAAISNGYMVIVNELLKKGSNPNYISRVRKNQGDYPLLTCLKLNKLDIAKLLIESGADLNFKNQCGHTLVFHAIDLQNLSFLRLILEHGANVNISDKNGVTPSLYVAKTQGFEDCLKLLLEFGPNIDSKSKDGKTLLHRAVQSINPENVKLVLEYCPSLQMIQYQDLFFDLIFHQSVTYNLEMALQNCNIIIDSLLDYGFLPPEEHLNNPNFLRKIVEKGFYSLLKNMLERGTNPNVTIEHKVRMLSGDYNSTCVPLFRYACLMGQIDIVRLLIDHGTDLNAEGCETALKDAIHIGNKDILEILLESNMPRRLEHLLHEAVCSGSVQMVEYFLEYETPSINVNSTFNGETLINVAVKNFGDSLIEVLWRYGADINLSGPKEECGTPLHVSIYNLGETTTKTLLEFGADLNAVNKSGLTPIDTLEESPCRDLIAHGTREYVSSLYYAGIDISRKCFCYIRSFAIKYMRSECEEQVKALKETQIPHTRLSFYDILTCSIHDIAKYAKNPLIMENLKSTNYRELFPLYLGLLRLKIDSGLKIRILIDQAKQILDSTCVFFNLPWHIVEHILTFLSIEDLLIINRVIQPREEFVWDDSESSCLGDLTSTEFDLEHIFC